MRSKGKRDKTSRLRWRQAAVVLSSGVLLTCVPGVACATGTQAASASTFGLLGPVGLVAVALGILGMAAGVFRQRKRTTLEKAEFSMVEGNAAATDAESPESALPSKALTSPTP